MKCAMKYTMKYTMKYAFCNNMVVLSPDSLSVCLQGEAGRRGGGEAGRRGWFRELNQKGEHTSELRQHVLVNWGGGSCGVFRDPSDHL